MVRRLSRWQSHPHVPLAVLAGIAVALTGHADQTSPAPVTEPTGTLTLSSACAAALAGSPTLASHAWNVRASEARQIQAGLRPNPSLGAEVEDVLGDEEYRRAERAQTTLQLSQLIELGGKRTARRDAASAERDLASRDYEVERTDVLADTAEKFIEVLAAQRERELARTTTETAETVFGAVRQRVQAGKTSSLEERRAVVALARRRIDEEHAEHELAVARRRLVATWGSTSPRFTEAVGDLLGLPVLPPFEDLLRRVSAGPEMERWTSAERLRTAELTVARARAIPDLTAAAGLRRFEASDAEAFVFGFSIPLPIFDRNQGNVAEATARRAQTVSEKRAAEVRIATTLFALYQELRHGRTALQSLRETVVPEAHAALTLSEKIYRQGGLSYLDLLDAQRTVTEVEREQIRVAAASQLLLIGIERLTGQPLHDGSPHLD